MTLTSRTCRSLFVTVVACSTMAVTAAGAYAASTSVEMACAADYFAHCSKHDPDSPGVRTCMRAVGAKLSQRCIKALAAAGEIPSAKTERRASAR